MTLPIHVNLEGKRCVVVGAGSVAERKVETLRAQGAVVRLVAPEATPALRQLASVGALTWMRYLYNAAHLDGAFLVVAATDLPEINATVTRDAAARNILACRADNPAGGSFTFPAQVTRGDLVLTVSTSGKSPTLAAVLRERLEAEFGPEWARLTALVGALRERIKACGDEAARKAAVRRIVDDEAVRILLAEGETDRAIERAEECL